MVGWSGGVWQTYPDALGATTWNALPAFGAGRVRNDYTITAGTPTTMLGTTTVPGAPGTTQPTPTPRRR